VLLAIWAWLSAPAAMASCRVSDLRSLQLSSLYDRLKQAAPGEANYYSVIANSANRAEARQTAQTKLDSLHLQNSDDYATIWASDFLDDEQSRNFVTCSSNRRPGIVFAGRLSSQNTFNLSFAHLTPIGVEKIRLRLVASHNIANIDQFETFLEQLGEKDNYTAQTFALTLSKPNQRAVVIVRAGWETPLFIYIPAYPWPDVH
jgi:hypothetical protein